MPSSMLENNRQLLVHIATEIIALLAVIYYFSSKNKTLSSYIEDLSHRIDEQEDQLQKQAIAIKKINEILDVVSGKLGVRIANTQSRKIEMPTPKPVPKPRPVPKESTRSNFPDPRSDPVSTKLDSIPNNVVCEGDVCYLVPPSSTEKEDEEAPSEYETIEKDLINELKELDDTKVTLQAVD